MPDHRGSGYGKLLLTTLAKEVVAMNGGRLEWSVLKWNQPSIDFYEKSIGAVKMEEMRWRMIRSGGRSCSTTMIGKYEGFMPEGHCGSMELGRRAGLYSRRLAREHT